jgi:F-type H+-transporting ATPase subunit a
MDAVFPEVAFTILGIPIRDAVISTWIMMIMLVAGARFLVQKKPALLEIFIDFVRDTASSVMGVSVKPYIPMLGTLMVFIAVANNFSVLPVVTSPTGDINTPLALALVVFFSVHYYGMREKGVWGYIKDLASPIFMLPLEFIGQFSRTLSLTLRLFGNIVSSEIVVAVIFSLVPLIAPLPLVGLGLITGVLQAYIFTVLASLYIGSAVGETS